MENRQFPDDFLWGAATSAHQVEGGNHNDWSEWEDAGNIKDGSRSGLAADHWHHWREDFGLLDTLNLNAYRFSIEWSRVEPAPGEFDQEAIRHYREMLMELRKRDITPVVTLHHFTNPVWLNDWNKSDVIAHFIKYVEYVASELGEFVPYWCTINEPNIFVVMGYMTGERPPERSNILTAYRALRNVIKAHKQAYQAIHRVYQENGWDRPAVSMAYNLQYFKPARWNPLDKLVTAIVRYTTNQYTLKRTLKHADFIGLNYYFANRLSLIPPRFAGGLDEEDGRQLPHSDMGWVIYPEGLYHVLLWLRRYGLPVLITENGLADAEDRHREMFITEHVRSILRAINAGVNVHGYLHWSLLDNFEWQDGYTGRFGLVAVDFETQERTIRPSARAYARIAQRNRLPSTADEESV